MSANGMPPHILCMFHARPAFEYLPPIKRKKTRKYTGLCDFNSHFEKTAPPPKERFETPKERHKRKLDDSIKQHEKILEKRILDYDPFREPKIYWVEPSSDKDEENGDAEENYNHNNIENYSGNYRIGVGSTKRGETEAVEEIVICENQEKSRTGTISGQLKGNIKKGLTSDGFRTLFVARLSYDTTEKRLKKEFKQYGSIRFVRLPLKPIYKNKLRNSLSNSSNSQEVTTSENPVEENDGEKKIVEPVKEIKEIIGYRSCGYAFIEFDNDYDMKTAYKQADGKKIDGRRLLVDVERGRTVKGWLPRRLGGGRGPPRGGGKVKRAEPIEKREQAKQSTSSKVSSSSTRYSSRPPESSHSSRTEHRSGYSGSDANSTQRRTEDDSRRSRRGESETQRFNFEESRGHRRSGRSRSRDRQHGSSDRSRR